MIELLKAIYSDNNFAHKQISFARKCILPISGGRINMSAEKLAVRNFIRDNQLDFNNTDLLAMALRHPSYAQEKNSPITTNG
jgi:hypothetical protein